MRFKHSFHVFVDNFTVTYKQLLYRLVIMAVAFGISYGALYPFVIQFIDSDVFRALIDSIKNYTNNFLMGNFSKIDEIAQSVQVAYAQFTELLNTKITEIVLMGLLLLFLYIVQSWFAGLGNYTTAVIINEKMALRSNSPFLVTLISNLKEACLFNLIYVPLSILYDLVISVLLIVILFYLLSGVQFLLISLFLFTLITVLSIAVKMTFTCDWLPALIRGKMRQRDAIRYTFSRKNKDTLSVYSNFVVIILIIMAINVAAALFTIGVGLLVTVPASYVIIISFEMVNYYDREEIRYFVDKNTIIKPDKEKALTREEFFTGSGDDN